MSKWILLDYHPFAALVCWATGTYLLVTMAILVSLAWQIVGVEGAPQETAIQLVFSHVWYALFVGIALGVPAALMEKRLFRKNVDVLVELCFVPKVPFLSTKAPSLSRAWLGLRLLWPYGLAMALAGIAALCLRISIPFCVAGSVLPIVLTFPEVRQRYRRIKARALATDIHPPPVLKKRVRIGLTAIVVVFALALGMHFYLFIQVVVMLDDFKLDLEHEPHSGEGIETLFQSESTMHRMGWKNREWVSGAWVLVHATPCFGVPFRIQEEPRLGGGVVG